MSSRHAVDTTTTYRVGGRQRASRRIEKVETDVPAKPTTELVQREPYLPTPEVVKSVDIAIALGRPLLLQGDPGSGKTRLAHAVAYTLGLPLERAHVKSTTRAQDLLYTFDAIARLYDVQLGALAPKVDGRPRPEEPGNYVRLGAFGRAIRRAQLGRRSVVLIDEIDKADLDFPNDLLNELDRLEMHVAETDDTYRVPPDRPDLRPIVFVTHNEEKSLPPAFLRRCVYHELRSSDDPAFLGRVLAAHDIAAGPLARAGVEVMLALRKAELSRKPGLSELIDWVRYLDAHQATADDARELVAIGAFVKEPSDQELARKAVASMPRRARRDSAGREKRP